MTDVWCIDLGSAFVRAALAVDGGPPLEVPVGLRSVALYEPDGTLLVGGPAIEGGVLAPERFLAVPRASLDTGGRLQVVVDERIVAVPAAAVCAELLRTAFAALGVAAGGPPDRLVLTCPAAWDEPRRDALRDAAARAGLPAVDLLAEPVAAIRAHPSRPGSGALLVVDVGATSSVTVARRDGEILALGESDCGGTVFDALLARLVGDELARTEPDAAARFAAADRPAAPDGSWDPFRHRLASRVTATRESLSDQDEAKVSVAWPGGEAVVTVRRKDLVDVVWPLIEELAVVCEATVARAGVPAVDAVVLVGGAARTPGLADALQGIGPVSPPDEPGSAVVRGGARTPAGLARGTAAGSAKAAGDVRVLRLSGPVRELVLSRAGWAVAVTGGALPVWCDLAAEPPAARPSVDGPSRRFGSARGLGLTAGGGTAAVVGGEIVGWHGDGRYAGSLLRLDEPGSVSDLLVTDEDLFLVRDDVLESWQAGRLRWRVPVASGTRIVARPGGDGLLVAGPAGLRALDGEGDLVHVHDRRAVDALSGAAVGVLVAYADEVVLLEAAGRTLRPRWSRRAPGRVTRTALGGLALIATAEGRVRGWTAEGEPLGLPALPPGALTVAVAPDDHLTAAGYSDGTVRWWQPGPRNALAGRQPPMQFLAAHSR